MSDRKSLSPTQGWRLLLRVVRIAVPMMAVFAILMVRSFAGWSIERTLGAAAAIGLLWGAVEAVPAVVRTLKDRGRDAS